MIDRISITQSISLPSGLYVNGQWVTGNGPHLDTVNPATEQLIATIQTASPEDVDTAANAARETFEEKWGNNVAATRRGQLLFQRASLLAFYQGPQAC